MCPSQKKNCPVNEYPAVLSLVTFYSEGEQTTLSNVNDVLITIIMKFNIWC